MEKMYTKKQVAEIYQCSVRKIEKMMALGEISYVKIGAMVRFRETDLDSFTVVKNVGTPSPNRGEMHHIRTNGHVENTATYGPGRNGSRP